MNSRTDVCVNMLSSVRLLVNVWVWCEREEVERERERENQNCIYTLYLSPFSINISIPTLLSGTGYLWACRKLSLANA